MSIKGKAPPKWGGVTRSHHINESLRGDQISHKGSWSPLRGLEVQRGFPRLLALGCELRPVVRLVLVEGIDDRATSIVTHVRNEVLAGHENRLAERSQCSIDDRSVRFCHYVAPLVGVCIVSGSANNKYLL